MNEKLEALAAKWETTAAAMDQSATAEQQDVGYQMGLEDCAEELRSALASPGGGWRPIAEAPRDGWILGWRDGWDSSHTMRRGIGGWRNEIGHISPGPTHWQPLPVPPAAKESEA